MSDITTIMSIVITLSLLESLLRMRLIIKSDDFQTRMAKDLEGMNRVKLAICYSIVLLLITPRIATNYVPVALFAYLLSIAIA